MQRRNNSVDLSTGKVISDSFFYSIARIAILIVKPIKGIVLGRLLGPTLYGILNIPSPYVSNGAMLSNIGYNTSVLKLMPGYMQEGRPDLARMIYRSTAVATLALSSLWTVLLLAASPWISNNIAHEQAALNPLRIYAMVIPFLALNTFFTSVYFAVQRAKLGAAISFIYGILNTFLPIAIVLLRRNVTLIVGGILAAEIVGTVFYTVLFHKRVLAAFGSAVGPLWRGIKETTRFGFLFFVTGLGWNLINSADRIMIKFHLPADQLGFYSMGAQVILVLDIVASTLGFALVPALTASKEKGERSIFSQLVRDTSKFGFAVLMPIAFICFVLAEDFFALLLPRFGPSATIVRIVIAIAFIDLFCRIGWAALVAYGKGGLSAIAYCGAAAFNIAANAVLVPKFGINGAAIVVLATFMVLAVTLLSMMKRVSGCDIDPRSWLHPLLLSSSYLLLGILAKGSSPVVRIVFVAAAGTAIYIALCVATRLTSPEDIARLRDFLEPRKTAPHVRAALFALDAIDRAARFFDSEGKWKN